MNNDDEWQFRASYDNKVVLTKRCYYDQVVQPQLHSNEEIHCSPMCTQH